jgi:hypothetical protein
MRLASATILAALAHCALADPARTYQLDPFAQATSGYAACPAVPPPLLDEQEMRTQAHSRAERGTSCCLAGTCPCGGAYSKDFDINAAVVSAIAADAGLTGSSVWVTTTRRFVTLQGCVRSTRQRRLLEQRVKAVAGVELVWNETTIGIGPKPR